MLTIPTGDKMADEVLVHYESGVMEIRLNRPEKMNAVTKAMTEQILAAVHEAQLDDLVKCLLISANGKAFCSGRDLSSAKPGESASDILSKDMNPVIMALYSLSKPTVASVQGVALGFGLGLALACDVVHASRSARFGIPFSKLGAALDCGCHWLLRQRISSGKIMELIYSAENLDGTAAASLGLIERCWPDDELYENTLKFVQICANGPSLAFARQKDLLRCSQGWTLEQVLEAESKLQGELSITADYREGIQAFLERRPAVFRKY